MIASHSSRLRLLYLIVLTAVLIACRPAVPTAPASAVVPHVSNPDDWKLSVSPGESGTYRIYVASADGKQLQVIEGPEGKPPYDADDLLKLEDFTGDGRPDILARGLSVGASALTSETIYVFDAKAGRFLDAELFEHDGEVTRMRPGCIAVEYRNPDHMTYAKDQYCWEGEWVLKGSDR